MASRLSSRTSRPPKSVFAALTVVLFITMLSAFTSIGFVPYFIDGTEPATRTPVQSDAPIALTDYAQLEGVTFTLEGEGGFSSSDTTATAPTGKAPARISIPAIDLDLAVQNPSTTDVDALDVLLKDGPARYAPSASLGVAGNMIIFAHSSHLPVVHNKMYKAFNRIPELVAGDSITLTDAAGVRYLYRVVSLKQVDVNQDATISLAVDATRLTLVTCDTLAGKSKRFVLEAEFIGVM
jgi:LPXTG-site transpeptidase (sortase) family protein